jgi:hypothetical protein
MKLVEEGLGQELTFKQYPTNQHWLLEMRERINQKIRDHAAS